MNMQTLICPGTKVAVMGLGVSGRAAVRYALARGAEVAVSDLRSEKQLLVEEQDLLAAGTVEIESGGHSFSFLCKADLLIVSPGIDLNTPLFSRLLEIGVRVVGELAFAAEELKVPCIAVTGTNGKTTVTTLIGELLRAAGKRVFVGGNIGTSFFNYLTKPDGIECVVLEVSSFQLESAGDFAPDVAVLLNITPDHLDRHRTLSEYTKAKLKLFEHQGAGNTAILCAEDQTCRKIAGDIPAKVQMFGQDYDCNAVLSAADSTVQISPEEIYSLKGTAFDSAVGVLNSAAAILAVKCLGCGPNEISKGLNTFPQLNHRLQYVKEVEGVQYYNDSKATNTGAVISALGQFECRVTLIAGGRDKGDDYRLLRKSVSEYVRRLIVIGEAASLLAEALSDVVEIVFAESMKDAVRIASALAIPGEIVLLSPACASFDMFTSYGHRGNEFVKEVQRITEASTAQTE